MADEDDRTFKFEGTLDGQPIVGVARADATTVELLLPADGKVLEIPVEGFGQLSSTLMIAAHSRAPGPQ